jgi:hypothetical protein
LTPIQKDLLRARWLDQLEWLGDRAARGQRWYRRIRFVTLVGGVLTPALISWSLGAANAEPAQTLAFVVSLLVLTAAAIEEVFHFGDIWRQYRSTAEALKSEGWEFIFLSGPYQEFDDHQSAYRTFAGRVEEILRQDVPGYFDRLFTARRPSPK